MTKKCKLNRMESFDTNDTEECFQDRDDFFEEFDENLQFNSFPKVKEFILENIEDKPKKLIHLMSSNEIISKDIIKKIIQSPRIRKQFENYTNNIKRSKKKLMFERPISSFKEFKKNLEKIEKSSQINIETSFSFPTSKINNSLKDLTKSQIQLF